MSHYYILKGKTPVAVSDVREWAECFDKKDRHVAKTTIGDVLVSTVFLGLDHSFGGIEGEGPILFETMIFEGKHDGYQERYRTWEEAEAGHRRAVNMVNETP